jgi:crotonobetainyl-CoA:carnitine CoA-transferase CaiB-like acyl-CoA transferase
MGAWIAWPRVKELMAPALDDERFATPAGRQEHSLAFGEAMESWLINHDKIEAYHQGQAMGIPWGHVSSMQDLLESPQYAARNVWRELDHPEVGKAPYLRPPFRLGDVPDGPWKPAPRLGEHNAQVYGEILGYDKDDIVRLRQMGVI